MPALALYQAAASPAAVVVVPMVVTAAVEAYLVTRMTSKEVFVTTTKEVWVTTTVMEPMLIDGTKARRQTHEFLQVNNQKSERLERGGGIIFNHLVGPVLLFLTNSGLVPPSCCWF